MITQVIVSKKGVNTIKSKDFKDKLGKYIEGKETTLKDKSKQSSLKY